jgi:hypothetical protein
MSIADVHSDRHSGAAGPTRPWRCSTEPTAAADFALVRATKLWRRRIGEASVLDVDGADVFDQVGPANRADHGPFAAEAENDSKAVQHQSLGPDLADAERPAMRGERLPDRHADVAPGRYRECCDGPPQNIELTTLPYRADDVLAIALEQVVLAPLRSGRPAARAEALLIRSPKLLVSDSGLAAHLAGVDDIGPASGEPLRGALFETYVAQNLLATLAAWQPKAQLAYWHVQGRHEVDFVVHWGRRCVAI